VWCCEHLPPRLRPPLRAQVSKLCDDVPERENSFYLFLTSLTSDNTQNYCRPEGHSHLSSTRSLDTLRIVLTKLPGNFGVDNPIATWSGLQSIAGTDGNIKQQTHLQKVWENRHQPCRFLCAGPLYLGALIVGKMLS